MSTGRDMWHLAHLSEPLVQRAQLSFTQHRPGSSFTGNRVATMSARIHHEKCYITMTEVEIMLSWNVRLIIAVGIVNTECVVSICEGRRVVRLAEVIVDDLQAC